MCKRRGDSPAAATPEIGPGSTERLTSVTASEAAVAIGPGCDAGSCGAEAAPRAVVHGDSVADSCMVSSQSQASGRLQISGASGSSCENKHLMNHDRLANRLRRSASFSESAVIMARSCSPGSTGSPVA
jgi:hypothetical protein